jgi:excisionase family DNA binding protein
LSSALAEPIPIDAEVEQAKVSAIDPSVAPDQLPFLMTVAEWRSYWRLSRSAAYGLVKSGAVPVVRIGRHIRIPRSACCESK